MSNTTLPNAFVFQRCRHYGFWPELEVFGTGLFKMTCLKEPKLADAVFRVWYRAYGNAPDHEKPPTDVDADEIGYFRLVSGQGFKIGNQSYIEGLAGEKIGQIFHEKPKQGEVDLCISCDVADTSTLDAKAMFASLAPLMPTLVLHFSRLVGDVMIPTGQPVGVIRSGKNTNFSNDEGATLVLLPRPNVKSHVLQRATFSFAQFASSISSSDQLEISLAAKRITAGQQEADLIDKYCDFWEGCEFLCKAPKYKVDHRLAKMLEAATKFNINIIKNKIVGPLYDIRKNLVHDAIEDIERIKKALPILEDIAMLVFEHRSGMQRMQPIGPLADYYRALCNGSAEAI